MPLPEPPPEPPEPPERAGHPLKPTLASGRWHRSFARPRAESPCLGDGRDRLGHRGRVSLARGRQERVATATSHGGGDAPGLCGLLEGAGHVGGFGRWRWRLIPSAADVMMRIWTWRAAADGETRTPSARSSTASDHSCTPFVAVGASMGLTATMWRSRSCWTRFGRCRAIRERPGFPPGSTPCRCGAWPITFAPRSGGTWRPVGRVTRRFRLRRRRRAHRLR